MSSRFCPACGRDVGFPNVRLANSESEISALETRLGDADASATAGGYESKLGEFVLAVERRSKAIIGRSLSVICDLIDNDHSLYTSHAQRLAMQAAVPRNNIFDRTRNQFEGVVAPNFHQELRFAALALDHHWLRSFGMYAIVLRDQMIAHRSTVFEENPFLLRRSTQGTG